MQLSHGMEEDDTDSPPPQMAFDADPPASLFDDFVEDAKDVAAFSSEETVEADAIEELAGDDDGVDLWPEANEDSKTDSRNGGTTIRKCRSGY